MEYIKKTIANSINQEGGRIMGEIIDYYPTEAEKLVISNLCNQIIDILLPLNVPQKAFALVELNKSFEDVAGIKIKEIISSYDEDD